MGRHAWRLTWDFKSHGKGIEASRHEEKRLRGRMRDRERIMRWRETLFQRQRAYRTLHKMSLFEMQSLEMSALGNGENMMDEKQIDEMEQKIKKILREQYSLIPNKNTSLGRRLLEEHNRLKGMLDIIDVIKGDAVFYEQSLFNDKVYLGVRQKEI